MFSVVYTCGYTARANSTSRMTSSRPLGCVPSAPVYDSKSSAAQHSQYCTLSQSTPHRRAVVELTGHGALLSLHNPKIGRYDKVSEGSIPSETRGCQDGRLGAPRRYGACFVSRPKPQAQVAMEEGKTCGEHLAECIQTRNRASRESKGPGKC